MKASKIIASDFLDDLASNYARRWFIGGFAALTILCWTVISLMRGVWFSNAAIISIFENALANAAIILFSFVLYVYFIGFRPATMEAIRPQDIKSKLKELPTKANYYMFWGRSGSYFRSEPLLEIDRQSKVDKRTITIEVLLPDPDDARLLQSYSDILSSLGEAPGGTPLRSHVLATCITCALISANNKFVNVQIF